MTNRQTQLEGETTWRAALRPTTLIEAPTLAQAWGLASLILATETFQHTGSFKFRAAYNVARSVPQQLIIAASSGNFGAALAYACKLLGKRCIIVMPANSSVVKIDAVQQHGGEADFIDPAVIDRAARVAQLRERHPDAYIGSAYDDDLVIQGNATLGEELAALATPPDAVIAPIGGGGLASGLILGLRSVGSAMQVYAAEPAMADDAFRSLAAGHIIVNESEPQTIADGARTVSVGERNWPLLLSGLAEILPVSEEEIVHGLRTLYGKVKLLSEPTGALSLAALQVYAPKFQGKRVCCIISGGNVAPETYAKLLIG